MIKGIDSLQTLNYNAYNRINSNDRVDLNKSGREAEVKAQEKQQVSEQPKSLDLRLEDIRPRQNAALEDISLSLSDHGAFEMKGRDSDLESLDIEKAVSDMQKDQALMQYQYFVGDTNIVNNEDGIVIAK